jgi:hypothetical protein
MDVDPSDGTDYVFSALEWAGSGTLCGMRFGWTASLPGSYNEAGFWDFSDNNTFVKESQYDYVDGSGFGTCTGAGARVGTGDPAPPAAVGNCPAGTP